MILSRLPVEERLHTQTRAAGSRRGAAVMAAVAPPALGAHLQCSLCGHFSRSHAHLLTHLAAAHPAHLDQVKVGRLGNILMYQNTARLFHCRDCFFTCRDFTKIYKHLISTHCEEEEDEQGKEMEKEEEEEDEREGKTREEGEEEETGKLYKHLIATHCEEEEEEEGGKEKEEEEKEERKREDEVEEETGKLYKHLISTHCEEEEEVRKREEAEEWEDEGETKEKTKGEGEEQKKKKEEGEEQKKKREEQQKREKSDGLKWKRSSEEEEGRDEEASSSSLQGDESVLMFDGSGYHCLLCGWKTKLKALGVNHAVRKHDIPKAYACQAIRRDAAQDEGVAGLSGEQLKEEMEATARVVRFISNRFVCLLCGWKTKLKGFAISHVVRCHDVPRPYGCRRCARCFFLPSRLQQHVRAAHRPGRYACPFCCFRSHFLSGFRRHCSRCNARGEGPKGAGPQGDGAREEEDEEEERTQRRGARKRRRTERVIEEQEEEEEEE